MIKNSIIFLSFILLSCDFESEMNQFKNLKYSELTAIKCECLPLNSGDVVLFKGDSLFSLFTILKNAKIIPDQRVYSNKNYQCDIYKNGEKFFYIYFMKADTRTIGFVHKEGNYHSPFLGMIESKDIDHFIENLELECKSIL